MVKNLPAMQEAWVRSFGWEDPLEIEHGIPLQYSGLENPRGQGSLVGYSPWGRKESDTPERLRTAQHTPSGCVEGIQTSSLLIPPPDGLMWIAALIS